MESSPIRLFFGLPLPRDHREAIAAWQRTYPGIEGWSKPEGLHLTLAFLGRRPVAALPGLKTLAAAVASRHPAFDLTTTTLGSFSHTASTRLLWLGLAPHPGLVALAQDLREVLQAAHEDLDAKPFHPHLTLARFRQAHPLAGFSAPPPRPFRAGPLALFESRPRGNYVEVGSWPLPTV